MKTVLLIAVVGVVCVVVFIAGVVSPSRSRRMQQKTDGVTAKGEVKGDQKAGKLGDLARKAFRKSRHAVDLSAEKGREVHHRVKRD